MGMYSVQFGDYDSLKDWGLYLSEPVEVSPPEVQTYYVEVPGRNGAIDLSESLNGGVAYNDRQLTFNFVCRKPRKYWPELHREILAAIHGKRFQIVLSEDPAYYYEGRVFVEAWNSKTDKRMEFPKVTATVGPFKWENDLTELTGVFTQSDVQQSEVDITPENVAAATFNTDWRFGTATLPEGLGVYISWTIQYDYVSRGGSHFVQVSTADGYYTATLDTSGSITITSDTLANNGVTSSDVYRILLSGANNATIVGTTYPGFTMELEGGADNTELAVVATEGLVDLYLNGEYMLLEDPIWTDCSELTLKEGSNTLQISGSVYFGTVAVQYRRGWL